jgi:hypothetical protein
LSTNWIHRAGLGNASPIEIYSVATYVALNIITSGSAGSINPSSVVEYYFSTLIAIVGSGVWAYVISSGCGILATLDPHGVHFRHMMDELNVFSREKNLSRAYD